jgi:hypothetical protein
MLWQGARELRRQGAKKEKTATAAKAAVAPAHEERQKSESLFPTPVKLHGGVGKPGHGTALKETGYSPKIP